MDLVSETNAGWLTVLGKESPELGRKLTASLRERVRSGTLTDRDIEDVRNLELLVTGGKLDVSDEVLEKLRTLCMSWDIDLKPREITSHRKFIGPIIVAVKKLFYPVLRALLDDTLKAQRHFNGTAISIFIENAQKEKK